MNLERKIYTLNELALPIDVNLWYNLPHINGVTTDRVTLEITEKRNNQKGSVIAIEYYADIDKTIPVFKIENTDVLDDKLNLIAIERKSYYGFHTALMPIGVYEWEHFETITRKYLKTDEKGDNDWNASLQELENRRKNIKIHIEKECSNMLLPNGFSVGKLIMNDLFSYYSTILNNWLQNGYIDDLYSKIEANIEDFLKSGKTVEEVVGSRIQAGMLEQEFEVTSELIGAYMVSPSLTEGKNVYEWIKQYIYNYKIVI